MAVYEENFYKAENLEGCIKDAEGLPRILCFKDTETNTLGRIVLRPEDPNNPFENIGRSVVFAEPSHHRQGVHNTFTNPPTTLTTERLGSPEQPFILYKDIGAFEPVNEQNREELAGLIDKQQGLMEGHKGILKLALDLFNEGAEVIPADTPHLLRGIIITSHQHIINSNGGVTQMSRINQARADLGQWTHNPPPIGIQSSKPVSVVANTTFHAPYGQQPNVGGVGNIPVAERVGQFSGFQGQEVFASLAPAVATAGAAAPYANIASPPPSLWNRLMTAAFTTPTTAAAYPVGSHIPEASVDPRVAAQGQAQGAQGRGQGAAQGRGHGAAPGRGNPGRGW